MGTVTEAVLTRPTPRQRILVATEGGIGLRPLASFALKFASSDTALHLAAVTGNPRSMFPKVTLRAEEWLDAHQAVLASSKMALVTAQRRLAGAPHELNTSVLDLAEGTQSPAEAVASLAERTHTSMIVVTSFGRDERGRGAWHIDPEELVGVAPCPVLYMPLTCIEDGHTHLRTAMVAVDGSENSFDALSFVISQLPATTRIHVVYVVNHALNLRNAPRITGLMKEGMRALKMADSMLKQHGRLGETTMIGTSACAHSVADSIVHEAERSHADLVVLGSRGLSALSRWLLGSVTEQALRDAKRAVLVVPSSDDRVALEDHQNELALSVGSSLSDRAVTPPIFL